MRAIDDRRLMMREEDTSGIRRDDTVVANRNFSVADEKSYDKMEEIFRALANKTRLLILKEISYGPLRISELSRKIVISNSNVLFHIEQLRKAGLLLVDFEPSRKGFAQVVYPAHILNLVCNIRGDNREGDFLSKNYDTVRDADCHQNRSVGHISQRQFCGRGDCFRYCGGSLRKRQNCAENRGAVRCGIYRRYKYFREGLWRLSV